MGTEMSRVQELQKRLGFKGTRKHPKRKTHRRWWIAAAAIDLGFASLSRRMSGRQAQLCETAYFGFREMRGEARAEVFRSLANAAQARRMAFAYARDSFI
jgi:hypothetical protein